MDIQIAPDILLLIMLYATGMTTAFIASLYLLLRRSNAFAPDITPPVQLRRWTAAFFAIIGLGHLWYLPAVIFTRSDAVMLTMLIGGLLDCLVVIPLAIVVMLCMLQDRRRPLWPVGVMMAPLIVGALVCIVTRNDALIPWLRLYFLPLGIGLAVYMVYAVWQYGRWLRDNFADLEHKEVWQSFVAIASILLMFGYYVSGASGMAYECIIQVGCIALVCYLLWRVETLQNLETHQPHPQPLPVREGSEYSSSEKSDDKHTTPLLVGEKSAEEVSTPLPAGEKSDAKHTTPLPHREGPGVGLSGVGLLDPDDIELLLKQRCEDTQLYLQHDLTVGQLAHALGTNRTYLSQYFARKDTTYNAYIHELRIRHCVRVYHEAAAAGRIVTAQQLATESGYRNYKTFSLAFRQRMHQSITAWMNAGGQ